MKLKFHYTLKHIYKGRSRKERWYEKSNPYGQVILEILWLTLFISVFLMVINNLYNKGIHSIQKNQVGVTHIKEL